MSGSIEFQLFAPYNQKAALIGSFSDWQEIPMEKGEDGYFRTHVELEDGKYQYKFRVQSKSWSLEPDQWVEINDPYATQIDYKAQTGVARVKAGERIIDTYVWQHDAQPLPENAELVIYEMHVADFVGGDAPASAGDKFKRAIEKLDYLEELGINAIELMPITEYAGDYRWGYLVRYFFAPESSYGPPEDLKRLVDECHARGIRVFMDGIYNHTDEESPLILIDRDYWYYHGPHYPDDPANYWGPEFNYEYYDEKLDIKPAWKFVGDVVRFWVQEYHIDGIRFDAVRQLNHYDFLHWIAQEAKTAAGNKPFYNIAEHIPETACITCCAEGPMDGCWHESFRIFAIEHISGDKFDLEKLQESLDAKRQGFSGATSVVNYLASHDREHTLRELSDRGIVDTAAFERAKLGAVLLMTALGIPMIWMGDEFGEYQRKAETTTKPNPIQWPLLKHDLNRDLLEYYKSLIQLRKHTPALQTENIEFFHADSQHRVLSYQRWNDAGSQVVVVANFSEQDLSDYQISNFPSASHWHAWNSNQAVNLNGNSLTTDLPKHTARVFINKGPTHQGYTFSGKP